VEHLSNNRAGARNSSIPSPTAARKGESQSHPQSANHPMKAVYVCRRDEINPPLSELSKAEKLIDFKVLVQLIRVQMDAGSRPPLNAACHKLALQRLFLQFRRRGFPG
jgi:hypothetical protein